MYVDTCMHLVLPRVALVKGRYDETFAGEDGRYGELLERQDTIDPHTR